MSFFDLVLQQGKIYDEPKSAEAIGPFIETYSIQTDELLEPDTSKYSNFNEFFYRYAISFIRVEL